MAREHKFRGKRLDNGEWVEGNLINADGGKKFIVTWCGDDITACSDCGIPDMEVYNVDPETVGEYTGLRDKNGVEIYEGDIWKSNENGDECTGIVEYQGCAFKVNYGDTSDLLGLALRYGEVIGNIHEQDK